MSVWGDILGIGGGVVLGSIIFRLGIGPSLAKRFTIRQRERVFVNDREVFGEEAAQLHASSQEMRDAIEKICAQYARRKQ